MKHITFDKYINYLIIGLAFTLPTTIAGIVFFGHLIIISFLLKGNFSSALTELKKSKIIVILFLFLSLSLISTLWSSDKIFAFEYIKRYWYLLTIPVIYLHFNPKYTSHVFTSFLLGMLFSEILSYSIFFELIHFNNIPSNDPSPFMNHSIYSIFLAFSSIILLNRIFFVNHPNHKIFYSLYFLTTTSNLFLNGGRTGQIIFIISLFIIIFLNFKSKSKAIIFASAMSISILTIAYNVSPIFKERGELAYNDITQTFTDDDYSRSFGIRMSLWIMGANVFSENPLLGTGIGDEKTGMQKYADKYKITRYMGLPDKGYIDYHSMYVQYAVQLGIAGLILITSLIYHLFTVKFKSRIYRNLNFAFATSILITSTVSNILDTIFPMIFFTFFAAILSAISKSERSD